MSAEEIDISPEAITKALQTWLISEKDMSTAIINLFKYMGKEIIDLNRRVRELEAQKK